MHLVILANEHLKEELLNNGTNPEINLTWIESVNDFREYNGADAFLDLLFENTPQRIELLSGLASKFVIINSVSTTLTKINRPFVRINAWPGFLKRAVVEATSNNDKMESAAERVFSFFNRHIEWVADEPGFITARVIAMIINEAYFALEEKISTKQEIDTAMKLGTSYPYGPFEWGDKIGVENVYNLLIELSKINSRYKPARLLEKEATN
jgi:3-hydroxybutyryl-CoA dehydrogenase